MRPLASGDLTQKQALLLLAALLSVGLGILLFLNQTRYVYQMDYVVLIDVFTLCD